MHFYFTGVDKYIYILSLIYTIGRKLEILEMQNITAVFRSLNSVGRTNSKGETIVPEVDVENRKLCKIQSRVSFFVFVCRL